ncbi:hypothetical protein QYM46_16315 [Brevibacterium sp. K11IcPPYGO002]|uniref:hypothetical protein n=1 Tax=Brevibacterium sp. K11IcPPYGO002 TaxID=3058837 RepID=UPI003D816938
MPFLDNGPGYSDEAVTGQLQGGKQELTEKEQGIARASWMRAYSERKSKQLGGLAIPAAALGLSTAIASAEIVAWFAWLGVAAVLGVGAFMTHQLYISRGIEATEAAAAVHEYRASGCPCNPTNAPDANAPADSQSGKELADNGNEPAVEPNQNESTDDQNKDCRGGTTPPPGH